MKVKTAQIKNNPNNPRIVRDEKYQKLLKSIQDFPEMLEKRPLVCVTNEDNTYTVLGGNMRLKAIKELKIKEVDILLADNWSEKQQKEFVIKDNVSFGDWDWEVLNEDWDTQELGEWGLDVDTNWETEYNEDIDIDNIKSTEEREKEFKNQLVTCPHCEGQFNIQV